MNETQHNYSSLNLEAISLTECAVCDVSKIVSVSRLERKGLVYIPVNNRYLIPSLCVHFSPLCLNLMLTQRPHYPTPPPLALTLASVQFNSLSMLATSQLHAECCGAGRASHGQRANTSRMKSNVYTSTHMCKPVTQRSDYLIPTPRVGYPLARTAHYAHINTICDPT